MPSSPRRVPGGEAEAAVAHGLRLDLPLAGGDDGREGPHGPAEGPGSPWAGGRAAMMLEVPTTRGEGRGWT